MSLNGKKFKEILTITCYPLTLDQTEAGKEAQSQLWSLRKTHLTFIGFYEPKLTNIWHNDRFVSFDFSHLNHRWNKNLWNKKRLDALQHIHVSACKWRVIKTAGWNTAAMMDRILCWNQTLHPTSQLVWCQLQFKYLYSIKASLQAAACLILQSLLYNEATTKTTHGTNSSLHQLNIDRIRHSGAKKPELKFNRSLKPAAGSMWSRSDLHGN